MKSIERLKKIASNINLMDITSCNDEIIESLRRLRNLPLIRNNMYTNHIISKEEHRNWISGLKIKKSNLFFAVFFEDSLCGGASFNNIDTLNKRAEWAFYLNPLLQGKGLGAGLEYKMLEYAFNNLKLNKLDCEVLDFNSSVIAMHERFGFIKEGNRRERLIRNSKKSDSVLLGITSQEWEQIKKT